MTSFVHLQLQEDVLSFVKRLLSPIQLQHVLVTIYFQADINIMSHHLADNSVSHVLAVSSRDGATCLHRTIEGGDWPDIVTCLLTADSGCVNMQDHKGLSAVHLACQLGRKKTLDRLTVSEHH